jgi:Mce-associated membrane protein
MTEPVDAEPLSKAAKLEAKAARLRERDAAKALAAQERAAAGPVEPAARSRTWMIVAAILAIVLVVVLAVGVPYYLHQRRVSRNLNAERRLDAARATVIVNASKFAVDFASYDYQHLTQDFQTVAADLTPAFKTKYNSLSASLVPTIVQYKGKSTATVQGAGVAAVTDNTATVIVLLDQTISTTQSTTARIDRNRLEIFLQRQANGSWLVSDLQPR